MIEIKDVTKRFDQKEAVSHLTLQIEPGITGIVGVNGAGKSTLFRLISDVLYPDEGTIRIDGLDNKSAQAKGKLYFLSDDPYAPSSADLRELLNFYTAYYDVDTDRFYRLIDVFGLPKNKKVNTFSKGMRRQAFIAIALSLHVEILLLDEAFDGLDPLTLATIKSEIIRFAEGRTIVISSHNISALNQLVDRFVVIHQGKLSEEGTVEDLGEKFVKYQCIFPEGLGEEDLRKAGLNVISYQKLGSITHFVIRGDATALEEIKKTAKPTLLEQIPITSEEIVALQMQVAKEAEQHD